MVINITAKDLVQYCGETWIVDNIRECFAGQHAFLLAEQHARSAKVFFVGALVLVLWFFIWARTERLKRKLREQYEGKE